MPNTLLDDLYQQLKNRVTPDTLKTITAHIIQAYKTKQFYLLEGYARRMGLDPETLGANKLFAKLIIAFHPDKLIAIQHDIDELYQAKNHAGLNRALDLYLTGTFDLDLAVDYDEESDLSDDDYSAWGMSVTDDIYEEYPEEEPDEARDPYHDILEFITFYEAINQELGGNEQYQLSVEDLANLDGELDLSDYNIESLESIEYCQHISILNLCKNHIYDASPLANLIRLEMLYISDNTLRDLDFVVDLHALRELDIANNLIEDLSPLLELPYLEYVNVLGNPITTPDVVQALQDRGIVLVMD